VNLDALKRNPERDLGGAGPLKSDEVNLRDRIRILHGLTEEHIDDVVRLYDLAFRQKLALAIPRTEDRLALFRKTFSRSSCIRAELSDRIIGVVGYQLNAESFTGGLTGDGVSWRALREQMGLNRAIRAFIVFTLFRRSVPSNTLLLDGIAVKESHRNQGIGSRLLESAVAFAAEKGFEKVRLNVIGTNHRAKALYERKGFVVRATRYFLYLHWLFGFSKSYEMHCDLPPTGGTGDRQPKTENHGQAR